MPRPGVALESTYGITYPEQNDRTVAVVNGRALTAGDLKSFGAVGRHMGHGEEETGRGSVKVRLKELTDRELVIQYAVKEGVPREGSERDLVDLFYRTNLGMDYYEKALKKNVSLDTERLSQMLPIAWNIGEFEMVVFDNVDTAKKEGNGIRTKAEFEALKRRFPDRVKSTGELYRNSGFFEGYDDLGLFSAKSGEVYGAGATGIGPAVIFVKGLRVASPGEMKEVVEKAAQSLREEALGKEVKRIRSAMTAKPDRKAILEHVRKRKSGEPVNVVLGVVGNYPITSDSMRWLVPNEPVAYKKGFSDEELAEEYEAMLENMSTWFSLGEEAGKAGWSRISSPQLAGSFNSWKREYYFAKGMELLIGKIEPPGEPEIERFYKKDRKRKYTLPERVKISHIFTKENRKKLEEVSIRLKGGDPFEALAKEFSEDAQTSALGGVVGWITKDGGVVPEIEEAAFRYSTGEVTPVIKTARGFHLLKILERRKPEVVPLEKVRNQIAIKIMEEQYGKKKDASLRDLRTKAKIKTYPDRADK
ncbi:MAG: peptidylprolyl isomerase [bacterium]|nr:peptidylprolyl isomerase [bacterium]